MLTALRTVIAAAALATALAAIPGVLPVAPAAAQELTKNPAQVKAATYTMDPSHTRIVFSVNHLGFSTYYGAFPKAEGTLVLDPADLSKTKLSVTIDVAGVDTDDAKLDEHLRAADFFDAAKFPTATFTSTKVERTGETTAKITGDLTLKGVTKPVTLDATFNQGGINPASKLYTVGFDATTTITRSEFGVSAYVPFVGDAVTLKIGTEFFVPQP